MIDPQVAHRLIACLDYTRLDPADNSRQILGLCARAVTVAGPVAAVCVLPKFVAIAKSALANTGVAIATVANFPAGDADIGAIDSEVSQALNDGANEIDFVVDYRAWSRGAKITPIEAMARVRKLTVGRTLKVIVESGMLDESITRDICEVAREVGANFVKTSTGKASVGARLSDANVMLAVCQRSQTLGFKASGGIRTGLEAFAFLQLADNLLGAENVDRSRFRIGASSLLDDLLAILGVSETHVPRGEY
jgi:deoxyribose-phosphate aldolase